MLDTIFWRKYFKTYDVLNVVIPYVTLLEELIYSLNLKESDVILDAGSGTGNLSARLIDEVSRVVALDSSIEGLEITKNKNDKIDIIVHDLSVPLPFEDEYFTKIVSNNVIYTLPPEKRVNVFREFYRILKPGGIIVVSNIRKGWKPINIYKSHIREDLKKIGMAKLVVKIFKMILPTLKMFYYNSKIKKEAKGGIYSFLDPGEQRKNLEEAGFVNISEDKTVYANQAILNIACK